VKMNVHKPGGLTMLSQALLACVIQSLSSKRALLAVSTFSLKSR